MPALQTSWFKRSAAAWFAAAMVGQLLFVLFILLFYYPSTLSGNFAAWDGKPNIEGFAAGDTVGNLMFAVHVLLAAVMTLTGLFQLLPVVRRRWPRAHRISGRVFLSTALLLSIGGLWLVWVRGTMLTFTGGIGISFNAGLIFLFAGYAWRTAVQRRIVEHRRWALRLFITANGVWFMRLGYIIWGAGTGGLGIGDAMDGPFDYFLAFGNVLVPLALLEIYLWADSRGTARQRTAVTTGLFVLALLTFGGSIAAWLVMWSPYI
jgi:uncharacterized membrane protein YozB (DUF420 family)